MPSPAHHRKHGSSKNYTAMYDTIAIILPVLVRYVRICSLICGALIGQICNAQWSVADTSGSVVVNAIGHHPPSGAFALSSDFYKSLDQGDTWSAWTPTQGGLPMIAVWKDVYFTSSTNGAVAGAFDLDDQYAIIVTSDGGFTWSTAYFNNTGGWPRRLNAMTFPLAMVGYAVGTNGRVIRTLNGGANWSDLPSGTNAQLTSAFFWTTDAGLIAGDDVLSRTANGGVSWNPAMTVVGEHHVAGAMDGAMVACGPDVIHVSLDSGVTWLSHAAPFSSPRSISAIDQTHFVVVDDGDGMYFTASQGSYWEKAVLPVTSNLKDVLFFSMTEGCATGKTGSRSLILKTSTGPGPGIPIGSIDAVVTPGCGSTQVVLTAVGVDPAWALEWSSDGTILGNAEVLTLNLTAPVNDTTVGLTIDNGSFTSTVTWSQTLEVDQPISIEAGNDVMLCYGGTRELQATPVAGAAYQWSPTTGLTSATTSSPVVSGIGVPTTYTVIATSGLCTASDSARVTPLPQIVEDVWTELLTWPNTVFDFPDPVNGVASGGGTMYRTNNAGASWSTVPVPFSPGSLFDRTRMADPLHGFTSDAYAFYSTQDAWATSTIHYNLSMLYSGYTKQPFPMNKDTVFVYAQQSSSADLILRTRDGGATWATVFSGVPWILKDMLFLGVDTIFAVGGDNSNDPYLIRSNDGGTTWTMTLFPGANAMIYDIEEAPGGVLYATDFYSNLHRSTDRGTAWTNMGTVTSNLGTSNIGWVSANEGVARTSSNETLHKTVTGGECWQEMAPGLPAILVNLKAYPGGPVYVVGKDAPNAPGRLFSTGTPAVTVGFFTEDDTLCLGDVPMIANTSYGYTDPQWYLDGAFLSADTVPTLPSLAAGDHVLQLIAENSGVLDSVSTAFHIQDFAVTTVLSTDITPCWYTNPVTLLPNTNSSVVSYQWYELAGLDTLLLNGTGLQRTVIAGLTNTYLCVPLSAAGCSGPPSNAVTIVALDEEPELNFTSGQISICTFGAPVTTMYEVTWWTDVLGYSWNIEPPTAGTVTPSGNICSVTWSPTFNGVAEIRCSASDTCGAGPQETLDVTVAAGNSIVTQPSSLTVDEGDLFILSVQLQYPLAYEGDWFMNGNAVAMESYSYSVASAQMSMAGDYHWEVELPEDCGMLYSDTVTVTVIPAVGIGDDFMEWSEGLVAFPSPFRSELFVSIPVLTDAVRLSMIDVAGRAIEVKDLSSGPSRVVRFELPDLATGLYRIEISSRSGRTSIPVIKAE